MRGGERVKALIRRFVQVLVSDGGGATEFVAGELFLPGEVSVFYRERNSHLFVPWLYSSIPGLRAMINSPTKAEGGLYDTHKRDPHYADASSSPLWELVSAILFLSEQPKFDIFLSTLLLNHYHPAISLSAQQRLSSQPLKASADLS